MTEQEITQARSDLEQLGIEQLRCGVMLQLLKIEALTKERDELLLQIDIQAGSIEAVQAANQRLAGDLDECRRQSDLQMNSAIKFCKERNAARIERDALALGVDQWRVDYHELRLECDALAANHKDCVKCLGEALQDRADLAAAAKLALDALECIPQASRDLLTKALNEAH